MIEIYIFKYAKNKLATIIPNPISTSSFKQLFSFGKEGRFGCSKHLVIDRFYDIPTTKSKRSTSFGYGNKIDLSLKNRTPAPGDYTIKSEFEVSK